MRTTLSLATLGDLGDGAARVVIDQAIARAAEDVEDRGDDEKERKVNITLTMLREDNGEIKTTVQVGVGLPKWKTHPTRAKAVGHGDQTQLVFQSLAQDDANQTDIEDHMGKGKK